MLRVAPEFEPGNQQLGWSSLPSRDGGTLFVRPEFVPALRASGLDTFERVMGHRDGRIMRSVPGRSTLRIELKHPEGASVAYLKRYEREYLSPARKLLRFLHWPGAGDEAMHEWNALGLLRFQGFNTADPIAVGQRRSGGLVERSFLLTAEISGGVAAHDYARTLGARARRELVMRIADLTQRFHAAGFAHRDCYLSHIFVVPTLRANSDPRLYLIDLQRLFRPRCFRERWVVKDLGALGYSARVAGATRADLLCFFKRYFGIARLSALDRARISKIMVRIDALQRRRPKHDVIWDQPGVHPPNV
jgi:hypothetical protein